MADEKYVTINQLIMLEDSRPASGGGGSGDDGGNSLPPGDMKSVLAVAGMDGVSAVLKGVDPDDTLVKWAGTRIVRKVGSYPRNVADGVQVVDYQTRNQYANTGYVDTGLVSGETYYYRWFPYSDKGAVNMSEGAANRHICTPINNLVVGVIADWENNTYTRTDYAVGLNAGADFDQFKMYGQRRRCIVTDDRTVLAFYGDEAYTENGKLLIDVEKNGKTYPAGTNVQVMVYQPKFYYKVTPLEIEQNPEDGVGGYILKKAQYQVSEFQYEGFKLHPSFMRNGIECPYILLSAYEGGIQNPSTNEYIVDPKGVNANLTPSPKLSSIKGISPYSYFYSKNTTYSSYQIYNLLTFRKLAVARGTGWQLCDILTISCTQLLFLIEYASMNSQQEIGSGIYSGSNTPSPATRTGFSSDLGNNSGIDPSKTSTENCSVSYRGEENLWGNTSTWIDGINIDAAASKKIITWTDFNYKDDVLYENVANFYPVINSNAVGFIKYFCYSTSCDFMFIPSRATGNSALPVGDYCLLPTAKSSANYIQVPLFGSYRYHISTSSSHAAYSPYSGLFYLDMNQYYNSAQYIDNEDTDFDFKNYDSIRGSRLVCIPPEGAVEELLV